MKISEIKKLMSIDFESQIIKTGELSKIENINYKLGAKFIYNHPILSKDRVYLDWSLAIKNLVLNELRDGVTYSLAVLGQINMGDHLIKTVTFGNHLLINKDINIDSLITYIEGQIEIAYLGLVSGELLRESEDVITYFMCREISIIENIYKRVSNINYLNNEINTLIPRKEFSSFTSNRTTMLLKILPLSPLINEKLGKYGSLIGELTINNKTGKQYRLNHEITVFIYDVSPNRYKGIVYKKDLEYFQFSDILIDNFTNKEFIRIIGKIEFYIKNGNIIYVNSIIPSKTIPIEKRDFIRDDKYLTFDIECFLGLDNKFNPYSCAWYSKYQYKEYYVDENNSWDKILKLCIEDLFELYPNYTVYAHNLSNFDSIFILKCLNTEYKCNTIFKDNRAIEIVIYKTISSENGLLTSDKKAIKNKGKKVKLKFKDSLMLLPLSLRKLIKSFNIDTNKLSFPYLFIRKKEDLNYTGNIPKFEFFSDINKDEYNQLSSNFSKNQPWVFKTENSKYLYNDVKSLYEIIDIFSKEIYDRERINITRIISISGLALKIYLSNYYDLGKFNIKIPNYTHYKNIKKGYFGGRVEVFKTYGENLYYYDVNSLYPYIMKDLLPSGSLIYSTNKDLDFYFGFCYCTVNVPDNLDKPILPYRDENGNICNPIGSWSGWYSSELLKKARELGISVEVHYGYTYENKEYLFKSYVETYYNLRKQYSNNTGKNLIYKLLLNSLYGRLGLKHINTITKLVSKSEALEILLKYKVLENETIDASKNLEYIKFIKEPSDILNIIDFAEFVKVSNDSLNKNDFINRNVSISAMITSKAAIFMDQFINIENNECYYTDTDSVILEKPLLDSAIGKDIGKFKFIAKIKRAYFISPKFYCLVLEDGTIIKKTKGIPSFANELLTEADFIKLSKGENITINTSKVIKNIKDLTIQNKEMKVNITPLIKKREIIYNNGIIITKPLKIIKNKIIFQNLSLISYKNLNIIKYNPLNYINFYLYLISMLNIMDRNFINLILNIKYNSYKDIYDDLNNIIIKIFNLYPTRESLNYISTVHYNRVISKIWYSLGEEGEIIKKELIDYIEKLALVDIITIFILKKKDISRYLNKSKLLRLEEFKNNILIKISIKLEDYKAGGANLKKNKHFQYIVKFNIIIINPTFKLDKNLKIKLSKFIKGFPLISSGKYNAIGVLSRTKHLKIYF